MNRKKPLKDKVIDVFVILIVFLLFSKIFSNWEHFKDGLMEALRF